MPPERGAGSPHELRRRLGKPNMTVGEAVRPGGRTVAVPGDGGCGVATKTVHDYCRPQSSSICGFTGLSGIHCVRTPMRPPAPGQRASRCRAAKQAVISHDLLDFNKGPKKTSRVGQPTGEFRDDFRRLIKVVCKQSSTEGTVNATAVDP